MKLKSLSIAVSPVENTNTHVESASPQTSFDKIPIVSNQHHAASSKTLEWTDPNNPPPMNLHTMCNSISYVHSREKFNRSKLLKGEHWTSWEASENKQLDQHLNQKMFGKPCVPHPTEIYYL